MAPRRSITLEQRRELRRWVHSQHPKPKQAACIRWFEEQFDHQLTQSSVSESLSARYSALDSESPILPGQRRQRDGNWPELERKLLAWQVEAQQNGQKTSGRIIQEKAGEIWAQLPQYASQPKPEFSHAWLDGYKKRAAVRLQAGSAAASSTAGSDHLEDGDLADGEFQADQPPEQEQLGGTQPPARQVTTSAARKAIRTLIGFAENQEQVSAVELRFLERFELKIQAIERAG